METNTVAGGLLAAFPLGPARGDHQQSRSLQSDLGRGMSWCGTSSPISAKGPGWLTAPKETEKGSLLCILYPLLPTAHHACAQGTETPLSQPRGQPGGVGVEGEGPETEPFASFIHGSLIERQLCTGH